MSVAYPGKRCPRCKGPVEDTSDPKALTETFRCLQQGGHKNCEWYGLVPDNGNPEKPDAIGVASRSLRPRRGQRSLTRAIEATPDDKAIKLSKDSKDTKETTMTKQQQKRLANINYRAKKMGHAPPFSDLDSAEQWAAGNRRRGAKPGSRLAVKQKKRQAGRQSKVHAVRPNGNGSTFSALLDAIDNEVLALDQRKEKLLAVKASVVEL